MEFIYGNDFSFMDWLATVSVGLLLMGSTMLIAARLSEDVKFDLLELYNDVRNFRNKR